MAVYVFRRSCHFRSMRAKYWVDRKVLAVSKIFQKKNFWNFIEPSTVAVYKGCVSVITHQLFSCSKPLTMTSKIDFNKTAQRQCLLYDFLSGVTAAESSRRICAAFGQGSVCERTAQQWFHRFRSGNYSLEDEPRSGRPPVIDDEELQRAVEADPRQSTRNLATTLGCAQSTITTHLAAIGKKSKLGQWVPHDLTDHDRERRAEVCTSLLSYARRNDWLDSVVTGDEKWVLYVNYRRRRQWVNADALPEPEPKGDLHPRKVMLCIWWDVQGVIYFELLPPDTSITAAYYCDQLQKLADKLRTVRPGHRRVRFLHDNARPHVAKITRQKLLDLGWEVLPHPPYSPDLAPSDYHLFRALDNHLRQKRFNDDTEIKNWLTDFFDSQPAQFYKDGIRSLPDRWQKVIECDGNYFIE